MFFDNFKFDKIKWERFKLDNLGFDFKGNISDSLYGKISRERRDRIENFLWDNAVAQVKKFIGASEGRFTCQDGMEICYWELGDPSKETFVFLHGFGDVKENFFSIAKSLSDSYHVILPDLPGFGDSGVDLKMNFSIPQYGQWLGEFLNKQINERIHLMGNSLGGGVALQLVLNLPEKFHSLALIDCAGILPKNNASVYDELNRGENFFFIEELPQFDRFLDRVFVNMPYVPTPFKFHMYHRFKRGREWFSKILEDMSNGLGQNRTREENLKFALNHRVGEITVPTLILWGENDSLFPLEVAAMLHTEIASSSLVVLEEVGHCPQLEAPKKVLKRYRKFLKEIG